MTPSISIWPCGMSGSQSPRTAPCSSPLAGWSFAWPRTAWFVLWPKRPVYATDTNELYSVRYPEGWVKEELGSGEGGAFWSYGPDEDSEEVALIVGWGLNDVEDNAQAVLEEQSVERARSDRFHALESTRPDLGGYLEPRPGWDVGLIEETYTASEEWAGESEWTDPRRFQVIVSIFLTEEDVEGLSEGEFVSYVVLWSGPQSQREDYDRIIRDTVASFEPRPQGSET
jgi:hypothetical protein